MSLQGGECRPFEPRAAVLLASLPSRFAPEVAVRIDGAVLLENPSTDVSLVGFSLPFQAHAIITASASET